MTKNQKRKLKKEQQFRESLDIKRTDYYLSLEDGKQLKMEYHTFIYYKDSGLITVTKEKLCRMGLYAYKEVITQLVGAMYHRCKAWIIDAGYEVLTIKVLDRFQEIIVPRAVAYALRSRLGDLITNHYVVR